MRGFLIAIPGLFTFLKIQVLKFMSYFIFLKNLDNIENTIYRIAENESDLNSLNINKSDYHIISDSQENFNSVKYHNKQILKYNQNNIFYGDISTIFENKISLDKYILNIKNTISLFLENNKNHPSYDIWNNYKIQLNSLDTNTIPYPLNISLEQYLNDLGQPSFNPLQIP